MRVKSVELKYLAGFVCLSLFFVASIALDAIFGYDGVKPFLVSMIVMTCAYVIFVAQNDRKLFSGSALLRMSALFSVLSGAFCVLYYHLI